MNGTGPSTPGAAAPSELEAFASILEPQIPLAPFTYLRWGRADFIARPHAPEELAALIRSCTAGRHSFPHSGSGLQRSGARRRCSWRGRPSHRTGVHSSIGSREACQRGRWGGIVGRHLRVGTPWSRGTRNLGWHSCNHRRRPCRASRRTIRSSQRCEASKCSTSMDKCKRANARNCVSIAAAAIWMSKSLWPSNLNSKPITSMPS